MTSRLASVNGILEATAGVRQLALVQPALDAEQRGVTRV
jgi:hypothetical protein